MSDTPDHHALLTEWKAVGERLEKRLDDFNAIVMGSPESPMHNDIFAVLECYTSALSLIVDDNCGWLDWFRIECRFGKTPMEAAFSDGEKILVADIPDLLKIITE